MADDNAASGKPADPHSAPEAVVRLQRARLVDRLAGRVIRIGGIGVLLAVIAIFAFVGAEAMPLLRGADISRRADLDAGGPPVALSYDEYRAFATVVRADGSTAIIDAAANRSETRPSPFGPGRKVVACEDIHPSAQTFFLGSDDGRIAVVTSGSKVTFDAQTRRTIAPELEVGEPLDAVEGGPISAIAGRVFGTDNDRAFVVCAGPGGLSLVRFKLGASRTRVAQLPMPTNMSGNGSPAPKLTALAVALITDELRILAGLEDGRVIRWDAGWTDDPKLHESFRAADAAVTAIEPLNGGETIVTGAADGSVATWFGVRATANASNWDLTRIRTFDPVAAGAGGVRRIAATQRGKGFAVIGADGTGRVDYATTGSTRATLPELAFEGAPVAAAFSPKNDGLVLADAAGRIRILDYADPHPESGITALFGKIWYEGGTEPEHKWQSTGGTDEFEPKLSLTTLVFGTMKGVVFALLFSVPIALLAAIYTALFLPSRIKAWVKPTLEIMAALPSVVIGLLAALWLSPLVERNLTSVFASIPAFLLAFTVLFVVWSYLPRHIRGALSQGPGVLVLGSFTVVTAVLLAAAAGPAIETAAFGGDVKAWLRDSVGMRYDPRNALVVGFAMGFAVIPVIFTIAEDAISNVPKSLWAASEALGASRWQTTVRVVLPAATPGIFAALMLGFGRAVGETMIVLMATGNTPILSMSPFNGMRTISACIAVEIPEAPHGDTLYRVLFLAGALLFIFTFACNTGAEIVASRLRRRYGRAG